MDDKDFLTYFDNLIKADDKKILENTENIITTLSAVEHKGANKSENTNSPLGHLVSEDLQYSIDRLLKGTVSDNIKTKTAFSTALLGILRNFTNVQPDKYLEYVDKITDRKNAVTKGERSHFLLSRLIGIYILIVSKRLEKLPNYLDIYINIYTSLLENMNEGNWVSQLVVVIIRASLEASENDKISGKKLAALTKIFKSKFKALLSSYDHDAFTIAILCAIKQAEILNEKQTYINDAINGILQDKKQLTKVLDEIMKYYPEKHISTRLIAEYCQSLMSSGEQNNFWDLVVSILEESQEEKKANFKNYFVIISLLKYYIKDPRMTAKSFYAIVNHKVFQVWLKNLRVLNKTLQKVAKSVEKNLSEKIGGFFEQLEDFTILQFLVRIKEKRTYFFDAKNPLGVKLLSSLSDEDSLEYLKFLINGFNNEKESFQFYLNEIYVLLAVNFSNLSEKTVLEIAQFYLNTYTNFTYIGELQDTEDMKKEEMQEAITNGVRDEALTKFYSIIAFLLKRPSPQFPVRKCFCPIFMF